MSIVSLFPFETFAAKRYKAEKMVRLLYERVLQRGLEGDEGAIALYHEMKTGDYTIYRLDPGERHINALGYRLLEDNKTEEAVGIFEFMVSEYPESANAYDSLGEAYMTAGQKEQAIKNYQKSLKLNPGNDNAARMLEALRKH
jgi:tetratricopeptide (TPR) repeat protein